MLKKILIGIAVVVGAALAIMFGGGLLIDGHLEVSAQQRLKSPASTLYPLLSTSAGLQQWGKAWLRNEPGDAAKIQVKQKIGPDGVGMVVTWEMPDGQVFETWTLKEATPPTRVVYEVDFAGIFTTRRELTLTPGSSEGCDARWHETADIANPLTRWMTKSMDMKQVVENRNNALRALDIAVADAAGTAAPAP